MAKVSQFLFQTLWYFVILCGYLGTPSRFQWTMKIYINTKRTGNLFFLSLVSCFTTSLSIVYDFLLGFIQKISKTPLPTLINKDKNLIKKDKKLKVKFLLPVYLQNLGTCKYNSSSCKSQETFVFYKSIYQVFYNICDPLTLESHYPNSTGEIIAY